MLGTESQQPLPASPSISVVIAARNEGPELAATVTNMMETLPADQRQIIVVDDASTDQSTAFVAQFPEITLVRAQGVGVARTRNLGAARASGEIILFADAHVRAPAGWHQPIVSALREEAVGAVAPGIYSLTEPARRGFGLALTGPDLHAGWLRRRQSPPYAVPVLPGCFLAMRRETFRETGGFDDGMHQLGGNDGELSCRFWLLGYELRVVTEVEIGHLFRQTTPYPARWASVVHNRLRMAFVHFDAGRVERVVAALRRYESFPLAMTMMLETDVFDRRRALAQTRRFNSAWYCDKFSLPC
jgi:GT2 family glycosyltransferase